MPLPNPFSILMYDKARQYMGVLPAASGIQYVPRHNQQDSGYIRIPAINPAATDLANNGAHVAVYFEDEFLASGACRLVSSQGTGGRQMMEFQIQGHWRLFNNMLGWQTPTSTPGTSVVQFGSEYSMYEGDAETVVKDIVRANALRLGLPVTVAPDLGRGSEISVQTRMHRVADRLFPVVDQAGIGTSVRLVNGQYVVDVYTPRLFPITIDSTTGILSDLTWTRTPPEVTRVVVAGPGEGVARRYRQVIDTAAESAWGDVIEEEVDARDIKDDDPKRNALMLARGQERLAEGATAYGISITLRETANFTYGGPTGILRGDQMKVELSPGNTIQDVVRSVTLGYDRSGRTINPQVGEQNVHPITGLYRGVAQALKGLRNLGMRP